MPSIKFHSANLTLDELRDQCQALQEHDMAKIVHLQGAKVENPVDSETNFNQAQYVGVADILNIPELKFVAVNNPSEIPSIIADILAEGGQLIFDEVLFVKRQEQRVLGFGNLA
jgi:hypothetical protein